MGFSERSGELRRLGDRIADLVALTDVLGSAATWSWSLTTGADRSPWVGCSVHASHDAFDIVGLVLTNTAVHHRRSRRRRP